MTEPDFAVLRPAPGVPLPSALDGFWVDLGNARSADGDRRPGMPRGLVARPTGRFEVRADSAVAEVFEVTHVRPVNALA